mmetsp:Transcript_49450/g.117662  ORF Transcript_49450/g.117662 Transcript_49450/m.117662 type:complete len:697 (+) Transcript_49450:79-2169(+)
MRRPTQAWAGAIALLLLWHGAQSQPPIGENPSLRGGVLAEPEGENGFQDGDVDGAVQEEAGVGDEQVGEEGVDQLADAEPEAGDAETAVEADVVQADADATAVDPDTVDEVAGGEPADGGDADQQAAAENEEAGGEVPLDGAEAPLDGAEEQADNLQQEDTGDVPQGAEDGAGAVQGQEVADDVAAHTEAELADGQGAEEAEADAAAQEGDARAAPDLHAAAAVQAEATAQAATAATAASQASAEAASSIASLQARVAALQMELQTTKDHEQSLAQAVQDSKAVAAANLAKRTETEALLAQKTEALAEKEAEWQALETDLRKQILDWQSQHSDDEAKVQQVSASLNEREQQLEEAKTKIEQESADLSEAQNSLHHVEVDLASLRTEHRDLEALYEDPSLQHFLKTKATKVARHPGIAGATNKTFKYVIPTLRAGELIGRQWLNSTHSAVFKELHNGRFMAIMGQDKAEPWLPLVTGVLVYGSILVPFLCTVCCMTRVVCRPKLILTFCHLYFTISCLCASLFAALTSTDPLAAFAARDSELYLFVQVAFAIVFIIYALFILLLRCFAGHALVRGYRTFQLVVVSGVATAYYVLVWTPAMVDTSPQVDDTVAELAKPWISPQMASVLHWMPYVLLTCLFAILLRLEQLCWKDRTTMSVDVTDLEQVRALIKECKSRGGEMITELSTLVNSPESRKGD